MNAWLYNVRDFGATGDGATKDTDAVQRAVDACAAAGGGRVLLPPGCYLSGAIYLKSHVEMHLSAGSTLLGSPDREDYNQDDVFPENEASAADHATGAHLIIAYRQENVSITGTGTIDGHSSCFFKSLPEGVTASYRFKSGNFPIDLWRPGQMVFFCRCKRVSMCDAALINSPYWSFFLLGCEDVQIRGLTIENPPATRNGDGIDIDCSRNVTVSDCMIRSGDDCITVRANERPLGENAFPCENLAISNCILSTPCNAIRVGVGDGTIRRCTFVNIVVPESRTAISIVSRYSPRSAHGACIEQIHFSDFTVDAINPVAIGSGEGAARPAAIRDVSFTRFRVKAWAGSQLVGTPDVPLQRVRLSDFDWQVCGGTENCEFVSDMPLITHKTFHGMNGQPALPCAIYGAYLQDVTLDDIRVRWDQISTVWRDGLFIEQSEGVDFRNVRLRQPQKEEGAALHCRESGGVTLQGCRADRGTLTFLQMEDCSSETCLSSVHNDLSEADHPICSNVPYSGSGRTDQDDG